jgi:hypothetical protein
LGFYWFPFPTFLNRRRNGYADVVVSFYFGARQPVPLSLATQGTGLFLVLSALLTGCAALTKNEGPVLVGIHLVWLAAVLLSRSEIAASAQACQSWNLFLHSGCRSDAVVSFQELTWASERCYQQ